MNYPNESAIITIIQEALQYKDNLLFMKNYINERLERDSHPFTCSSGLTIMLTEEGSMQFSYYIISTDSQYSNISGVMSI